MLSWLPLVGCAPVRVDVPLDVLPVDPPAGVVVSYPVDARPASQRVAGGFYSTSLPVPFTTHGDANLRPSPLGLVDHAVMEGISKALVVDDTAVPVQVRVYVLRLEGRRDVSDAQWVSVLTGGLAGTVGKFLYPAWFEVDGRVRVRLDVDGQPPLLRDFAAYAVHQRPLALTWPYWSLGRRSPTREAFQDGFRQVHDELADEIGRFVAQAARGEPLTAGFAPEHTAFSSLDGGDGSSDTFDLRGPGEDRLASRKYGHPRFSMWTGHDTRAGDVVGLVGLPLDTFGYGVGVTDGLQANVDLTVLGLFNGVAGGLRARALRVGPTQLSFDGSVGLNVALPPERRHRPELASTNVGAGAVISHRPHEVTWFVAGGAWRADVRHTYDAFDAIALGTLHGVRFGPGVEAQVTPTAVVGLRLDAMSTFQDGEALALRDRSSWVWVPQIGVGLR